MSDVQPSERPLGHAGDGRALLRMEGIRKRFGDVLALDAVDLDVDEREVHGLLGGNGAGKTTLMNVLYGLYRADEGWIRFAGSDITVSSPRDAIRHGIGMVHQTFLQVDTYTVTENVVLGTSLPTLPALQLGPAEQRIVELSERFGLAVDPHAVVEELPVGSRQRVEILKALYRGARLLVLDEPTTNLTPQEVESLFGSLRAIVDEGMSVIFITHKIRETLAVCDRMTVMRNGRRVTTVPRAATDAQRLARLMVGDEEPSTPVAAVLGEAAVGKIPAEDSVRQPTPESSGGGASAAPGAVRVTVEGLSVANEHGVVAVHDCSVTVAAGEIVGVAGVAGNGQAELVEALAGVRPARSGNVRVDGERLTGLPTHRWLAAGVVYVPEDRHRDGILPTASVSENLVLGSQRDARFRKGRFLDWAGARAHAADVIRDYDIRAPGPATPVGLLSGGNIQRVILARAFFRDPRFLILHNPTRGLDLRSTEFVYDRLRAAVRRGAAVLLVSEDLDELSLLADRLVVLYGGRVTGERRRSPRGGGYDAYELGRLMAGVHA